MDDKTRSANQLLPIPVRQSLAQLGQSLALARRRRKISTQSMAERIGVSTATLRRLERGDPSVALGTFARALLVLGTLPRLNELASSAADELGLALMDQAVPKRISRRKLTPDSGAF